jgi:3-dehydroquinate synthase class II
VQPTNLATATAALEAGVTTLVFDERDRGRAAAWASLGRFTALVRGEDGRVAPLGMDEEVVATAVDVRGPADVDAAIKLSSSSASAVVVTPAPGGWAVIPAENLVAAWQGVRRDGGTPPALIVAADDADAALTAAAALQVGVDGVLLRGGDPVAVRTVAAALAARGGEHVTLEVARVAEVAAAGVGDRVCVDCTTLLAPGEGLCVGSFAGGALLVASERDDSGYVAARPFRVNAGAVHSYVDAPRGRTAYLAELGAGAGVLVVSPDGSARAAVVGRAKIEARPLLRVDVVTPDGARFSAMLQNAETVKLVGPAEEGGDGAAASPAASSSAVARPPLPPPSPLDAVGAADLAWVMDPAGSGDAVRSGESSASPLSSGDADALAWALGPGPDEFKNGVPPTPPTVASAPESADGDERAALRWLVRPGGGAAWRTISVADLKPGTAVYVRRGAAGRHTGMQVEERVVEK